VGDRFEVTPQQGEPFDAVLSSCEESPYRSPADGQETTRRVPFSLVFHGPAEPIVAQQTCGFRHAGLGEFDLFVVPLGVDEQGVRYEAVIS
jgi:hypothetical protein